MKPDHRYLVVGAAGFIGSRLYARLGPERAVATYRRSPVPGGVHFDAGSMSIPESALRGVTHAFLLQGIGKLDDCARDPAGTARINVDGMNRAIDQLTDRGVKIVFTSSDAVFDGRSGSWTEGDPVSPIMTYGKHKVAVERHIAGKQPPWIVARLSKVVGAAPGAHSLFGEWIAKIEAGEPIRCARDLVFTPIDVEDAVTVLLALADGDFSGIYHVCGPRSMTRLDLLNVFLDCVRRYREVKSEVIPCSIRDFPFLEARGLNGSMIPDKLVSALGRPCEDMESVCSRVAADFFGAQRRQKVSA